MYLPAFFMKKIKQEEMDMERKKTQSNLAKQGLNLEKEISARFENASENQMDELDFFMDLLDSGITLEDIKIYCPDKYEYSKLFMEEHGLL